MTDKTSYDVIQAAASRPNIGLGHQGSRVHEIFPPDYVIRATRRDTVGRLSTTTCLTPVNYGAPSSLAPPLLKTGAWKDGRDWEYLTIHKRQPGISLKRLHEQLSAQSTHLNKWDKKVEAYTLVLEQIAALPESTFIHLLEEMNHLTTLGRSIDTGIQGDNIMISDNKLCWVDCWDTYRHKMNNLFNVKRMLFLHDDEDQRYRNDLIETSLDPKTLERIENAQATINRLLSNAALKTHTPLNEDMANKAGVVFKEVTKIETIPPIALSATPQQLQETLKAIEQYIDTANPLHYRK
jgi:hypothetical protein